MVNPKTNNLLERKFSKNYNSKNLPKQHIKDNLMQELTLYIKTTRIFGISPYSISNTNLSLSKCALTYSFIYFTFHTSILIMRCFTISIGTWDVKLKSLIVGRMIAFFISTLANIIIPVACDRKLQECLHYLKLYDMTMKFKTDKHNLFSRLSLIVVTVNITICLFIAGVTYKIDTKRIFPTFYFFFLFVSFSLGMLKFLALAMSISMRFRHLNLTLMKGSHNLLIDDY